MRPESGSRFSLCRAHASNGFTLVEVLIAVAVVGLLTSLAVVGIRSAVHASRVATARQDLERIMAAIEQLAWDTGRWPGGEDIRIAPRYLTARFADLSAPAAGLTVNADVSGIPNSRGPYLDRIPRDPWGRRYFFMVNFLVEEEDTFPEHAKGQAKGRETERGQRRPIVASHGPTERDMSDAIIFDLDYIYSDTL